MSFLSIIDTAAFIWNKHDYQISDIRFRHLSALLIDSLDLLRDEKVRILLRGNLRDEMFSEFPFYDNRIHNVEELSIIVQAFLTNADIIEFEPVVDNEIISNPDIVYTYYSQNVKAEINHLLHELHGNDKSIKFLTFCPIWDHKESNLTTTRVAFSHPHQTIIHCTNELNLFIESQKPKFEHNKKHNRLIRRGDKARGYKLINGEKIYPFSSFINHGQDHSQHLLDLSIVSYLEPGKRFYKYEDGDNIIFVCFVKTNDNIYHGFDIPEADLDEPIRNEVERKYYEQNI